MTRLAWVSIALVICGCAARAGFGLGGGGPSVGGGGAPPPPPPEAPAYAPAAAAPPAEGGAYAPGEDGHWFQSDDYLISTKPYENKKLPLRVAKMTAAASGQTKAEAHFLLANGEDLWAATYYRTRMANQRDLRVGAIALCFGGYWTTTAEPPKNKHEARQNEWFIAAVTDVADLYKGRVTVGNASCALGAVRVPVQ